MGQFTDAGNNEMLDASTITHAALYNGDPSGAGVALVGARQECTMVAASGGVVRVTADATFDVASGETVNYVGYFSALTGGTLLAYDDLTAEGPYGSAGSYILESSTFSLT